MRGAPAWSPALVAVLSVALVVTTVPREPPPAVAAVAAPCVRDPGRLATVDATATTPMVVEGNALAGDGRLDAAEKVYETALALRPPEVGAGRGLSYVASARAEAARLAALAATLSGEAARACYDQVRMLDRGNASAQQAALPATGSTVAARSSDGWTTFTSDWLTPVGSALLPLLAALLVLLVLARLLTPLLAPPGARAWSDASRRTAWWAGFALVVTAALRVALLEGWRGGFADELRGPGQLPLAVVLVAVVIGVLLASRSSGARWRWVDLWSAGVALLFVALMSGLAGNLHAMGGSGWSWTLTLLTAVLGAVLLAVGRGHALRLQVGVRKGGDADPDGTAYLLGRLQQLGSEPPRGLKAPQQVDVTDLPSTAISALPAGKVASAVAQLAGLLTPSVPWRATVQDGPEDRVTVSLTRNGAEAATVVVDPRLFRRTEPGAAAGTAPSVDRGDVLTAAAAVVLTELSRSHRRLRVGLCGARQWRSIAAHVVGTAVDRDTEPERRRDLLAYAVHSDPRNALARAAYVHDLAEADMAGGRVRAAAERLDDLRDQLAAQQPEEDAPGWTALRLRTAHARTAMWLNAAVAPPHPDDPPPTGKSAVKRARKALKELRALLDATEGKKSVKHLRRVLVGVAEELDRAVDAVTARDAGSEVPLPAATSSGPPSLVVYYDAACQWALAGKPERAWETLLPAAGLPEIRRSARHDPWLARVRTDPRTKDRWATVIGPPVTAFTDGPCFGDKGPALRALGIREAHDLLTVTQTPWGRLRLARALDVPPEVLDRWRAAAESVSGAPPAAAAANGGGTPAAP